jgi:hypothetical protein
MKKLIAASIIILFLPGCSYFVPSKIKQEVSMTRIDCQTSIAEVSAMPASEARSKALNSLVRIQPHLENIECYMLGKSANKVIPKESEIK